MSIRHGFSALITPDPDTNRLQAQIRAAFDRIGTQALTQPQIQALIDAAVGAGGGASAAAAFVTIGHPTGLTAERALTGSASVNIADGGANNAVTLSVPSGLGVGDIFTTTTAATNVLTTIWTSATVPANVAWEVTASITGRATAGGAARCRYILEGLFYREAGALTQEGGTLMLMLIESQAGFDAALAVSGNTVIAQVKDDGVRTMSWSALIKTREIS